MGVVHDRHPHSRIRTVPRRFEHYRVRRRSAARAKPEEVGLSSERLARVGETLKADIEAGRIPGAVIAIARRGKLVALDAYGWRDKAANVPMTTDTIFNIASMTKPMTAVGAR